MFDVFHKKLSISSKRTIMRRRTKVGERGLLQFGSNPTDLEERKNLALQNHGRAYGLVIGRVKMCLWESKIIHPNTQFT
jgi:hypothetical protein